ncbi:MAG: agmatinase family protein, partial [Bacteroidota bacterium]
PSSNSSTQLDLFHPDIPDAWMMGLHLRPPDLHWTKRNKVLSEKARFFIEELEDGESPKSSPHLQDILEEINQSCRALKDWVYQQSKALLKAGKLVGLLGGEHSIPLGFLQALAEQYESFGILQIDAHMDLRPAYEYFTYSHASISYNALAIPQLTKLVQVGIRDCCQQEVELVAASQSRVAVFYDQSIKGRCFRGSTFDELCKEIVECLPQKVYISFDIDGLDPKLCPHTGTPVPGGLAYTEAIYLIKTLVQSGRQIIGFDLCEVAGGEKEWDGNVGARVLYELSCWMGKSNGLI